VCHFWLSHTIIYDNGINFTSKQVVSFVPSTKSLIDSPYPIILKAMAYLKSAIALSSTTCTKVWTKLKVNGQRKYPECSGLTGPPNVVLTGEISFSLAYETKVIIPIDIRMLTLRVKGVVQDQNDALLRLTLDHSEERRQQAQILIAACQQQIWPTHYKKVKSQKFQVGDLVLKLLI